MLLRIEEFAMDKVRILLVLSLMCAVSACDEGESNDRHGSNDVNGSFECDYPEIMCDNICVDLDKRHWVDCNECADGYVGRYGDPRNGCVASGYDPDPEPRPGPEPYECVGEDERICGNDCVSLSEMNWKDCNECADGYVSKDNDVVEACVCRTGEDCLGIGCVVLDEKNWSRCGKCKDGFADLDEDEANGCEARDCQFYGEERCEDNACYDFKAMNWSRCGECKKGYVKESEDAMSRCYNPLGKEHCEESGNTWCSTKCVNLADYNWSACHTCIDSSFEHKYGDKKEACVCPDGLNACDQKCIDFNEKGWKECGVCADGATPKNKDPKNGCECPAGKESCNGACVNYKEMNWQACGECAAGYDFAEDDETNTQIENNMGSIIGKAQSNINTGKMKAKISVYNTISHSVFPMTQGIVESPMIASIKNVNTSIENAEFVDEIVSPVNPLDSNMTYKSAFFYKEIVTSFGDAIGTDDQPQDITYRAFHFATNGTAIIDWTNEKTIAVFDLLDKNADRHNKGQTDKDHQWLRWKVVQRKIGEKYYKLPMINYTVSSW